MHAATEERKAVARALVSAVSSSFDVTSEPIQPTGAELAIGPEFMLRAIVRDVSNPASEELLVRTASLVMTPLLAAMAELIGYDEIEEEDFDIEGDVIQTSIYRRERSSRNRLLCLAIHGHRCVVCGLEPTVQYADAGDIIEVHHLEPVSMLSTPRPYDPRIDLVPLCPNCHRAAHTRRPVPYTIEELRERISGGS